MKNFIFLAILTISFNCVFSQTDIIPPVLIKPANEALDQMPDAVLDWYPVNGQGTITYTVQLDFNEEFTDPQVFQTTNSSVALVNLLFGQRYYWHVNASDQTGTSDWSESFSFVVLKRLKLDKPDNASLNEMPDATVSWKKNYISGIPLSGLDFVECQYDTLYDWMAEGQNITNINLKNIFFIDEENGWAVGEDGQVLSFKNGLWGIDTIYYNNTDTTIADTNISTVLNSVNNGFIVGDDGTLLYFEDGHWILDSILTITEDTTKYENDLYSVCVNSPEDIWIVTKGGDILHRDTSEYWNLDGNTINTDLLSLTFVDENNGWAVGVGGKIIYYNGTNWASQTSPSVKDIHSVFFVNSQHGWACGKNGTILFYDGSGWTEVESTTTKDLKSISFNGPEDGWATGIDGILLYYDGVEWLEMTSGFTNILNSVYTYNSENIWISGNSGLIISKNDDGFTSPIVKYSSTTLVNTEVQLENLRFDQKYFWRFRGIHAEDTTVWSTVRFFKTISTVALSSPVNNATNQDPTITLTWEPLTGINDYIYQVCSDPNFTFPCITGLANDDYTSITVPELLFGNTYYWRLQAAHDADTTDWSAVRSFQVINTVLLHLPANGSAGLTTLPALDWLPITGVDGYELRVYDEGFTYSDTAFLDTNMYNVFKPLELGKDYFWKVRTYSNGDTTNWSETWQFHTGPQGIGDISLNDDNINLYPNPSKGLLTFELKSARETEIQVTVVDFVGKVVFEKFFLFRQGLDAENIDLNNLNDGLYFIRFKTGQNVYTEKLIINK